jgi:hypothetical protein
MEHHPAEAGTPTEIRLARLGTAVVVSTPARRAPA